MIVKRINYNWFNSENNGEEYLTYEVGKNGVSEIEEYQPSNGLQKWNYVVDFEDGKSARVFNINFVEYFPRT